MLKKKPKMLLNSAKRFNFRKCLDKNKGKVRTSNIFFVCISEIKLEKETFIPSNPN